MSGAVLRDGPSPRSASPVSATLSAAIGWGYYGAMATIPQPLTPAPELFDPAGQEQAEAAFHGANPTFLQTAILDALRT